MGAGHDPPPLGGLSASLVAAIFTPIADFDAGVEELQLHVIKWSRIISEKITRKRL